MAIRAAVLGLLAAVAAVTGSPGRGIGLVVLATVLTVVGLVVPRFAAGLDRVAAAIGHGAGTAVSGFGAVLVEVLFGLPGRALASLRRRDPLTGLRPRAGTAWRTSLADAAPPTRAWASVVPGAPPRRAPRGLSVLGLVVLVLGLDLWVGTIIRQAPPRPDTARTPAQQYVGPIEPGMSPVGVASPDSIARRRALAASPWAAGLYRELAAVAYDYQPILGPVPRDRVGSAVTVVGHRRVGFEPPARPGLPVVWVFGGSTVFGEGQRDDHTIPSELARVALTAGRPIRVVNQGRPGATVFSEALLFEQLLAHSPRPDLVVFLDGVNDIDLHWRYPSAQPTAFPAQVQVSAHDRGRVGLARRWQDNSFLYRAWQQVRARAAGAETAPVPRPPAATIAVQTRAVWARSLALARLAAGPDVVVRAFAQPAARYREIPSAALVLRRLPRGVEDLTRSLDGAPGTYVDGVHTNERGARIVAAALYARLRNDLRRIEAGG